MGIRATFHGKAVAAAGLVLLSDQLFWAHDKGWTVGLFGLALTAALVAVNPAVSRSRPAMTGVCLAVLVSLIQIERASVLGWLLIFGALSFAALAPRAAAFDDVFRWAQRLLINGVFAWFRPMVDLWRLGDIRKHRRRPGRQWLPVVALPAVGGVVFLILFAQANPVIGRALTNAPRLEIDGLLLPRLLMAGVALTAAVSVLRPRPWRYTLGLPSRGEPLKAIPGISPASVTLSLLVFNALFALENGLDIAFLWSGARLPEEFTLAEYAHRGAASLMVASLLAGGFVLLALRPGSEAAGRPLVRGLVIAWVLQTIFLVASCLHRAELYVESYSLTEMRIFGVVWMGLVAVALALILWRMLRGKSAVWLVNANALVLGLVLMAATLLDPSAMAAEWNLTHTRQFGGKAVEVDLCYLERLGPSALVALSRAEHAKTMPVDLMAQIDSLRSEALEDVERRQQDWRGWTYSNARRLKRALRYAADPGFARSAGGALARVKPHAPDCHGD